MIVSQRSQIFFVYDHHASFTSKCRNLLQIFMTTKTVTVDVNPVGNYFHRKKARIPKINKWINKWKRARSDTIEPGPATSESY